MPSTDIAGRTDDHSGGGGAHGAVEKLPKDDRRSVNPAVSIFHADFVSETTRPGWRRRQCMAIWCRAVGYCASFI